MYYFNYRCNILTHQTSKECRNSFMSDNAFYDVKFQSQFKFVLLFLKKTCINHGQYETFSLSSVKDQLCSPCYSTQSSHQIYPSAAYLVERGNNHLHQKLCSMSCVRANNQFRSTYLLQLIMNKRLAK